MADTHLQACPVCSSTDFTLHIATKDFAVTGEDFNIIKCTRCGLGITSPRPSLEQETRYYESDKYISHTGGTQSLVDRMYRLIRSYATGNKLQLIRRHVPKGKLLDFGCGTGHFLSAAQQAGWTCTGIEPSANARKRIRDDLKVYESIDSTTDTFHAITLWHVLEHINDLHSTFTKIKDHLQPGGTLFIAVPNHESFDAKRYGKWWAGYDVPRHLWHFTKHSLTQFISSYNLKLIDIHPMTFDAYYVSLLSESYKTPGSKSNLLRAAANGLQSNMRAGGRNYSSLIYIARS